MRNGQRFRLEHNILAVILSAPDDSYLKYIPEGAVVKVLSVDDPTSKFMNVRWNDVECSIFITDLLRRGTELSVSAA